MNSGLTKMKHKYTELYKVRGWGGGVMETLANLMKIGIYQSTDNIPFLPLT